LEGCTYDCDFFHALLKKERKINLKLERSQYQSGDHGKKWKRTNVAITENRGEGQMERSRKKVEKDKCGDHRKEG
jgi:hypothetical protein